MVKARGLPLKAALIFLQAGVVGLLGGLLGIAFRETVDGLQWLLMGSGGSVTEAGAAIEEWWLRVLIPAVGGLLGGLCLLTIKNVRGPFGIADVMEIVITRRGTIRPLQSLVQILSSAFSLSSGGSVGREGANSQLGATVAALLGRFGPPRSRAVLLGCGIAAGMASAYKAPIAGAMFVMEVVLGNFAMDVFAPVVVASVLSTLVTIWWFGYRPLYDANAVQVMDTELVLSAMLLGLMCGGGGILFRKSLDLGRALFDRVPLPLVLRMTLGGAIVGAIGIGYPEVWGNGQVTIDILADFHSAPTMFLLVSLLVWKVVATAATTGSGALGGVFTPNMVVGAAFGAAFGVVVAAVYGTDPNQMRTAFALVGMAGLCAATTHAPITAIVLVFELTRDYGLILPLMLCSIIASITARLLDQDSIYSARLREKGHTMPSGLEELAMHTNFVRDIMRHDDARVVQTAPFDEVLEMFNTSRRDTIYVVDDKGILQGHIQLHDVKYFLNDATLGSVVIAADLTRSSPSTHADESLASIIPRFDDPDLDELPVVRSEADPVLEGRITRRDLVTCLSEEVLGKRTLRARLASDSQKQASYVELPRDTSLERVPVPESLRGRAVGSLDLLESHGLAIMMLVRRAPDGGEERVLPMPDQVLADHTELIVIGAREGLDRFRSDYGLSPPVR
jgi:CIC family chloride channel protein